VMVTVDAAIAGAAINSNTPNNKIFLITHLSFLFFFSQSYALCSLLVSFLKFNTLLSLFTLEQIAPHLAETADRKRTTYLLFRLLLSRWLAKVRAKNYLFSTVLQCSIYVKVDFKVS
ncbi:MAG: hypothetical protein JW947_10910, partial [Sedimentisphaerales bacterium]|nr:hypothetical protein [Sedimentisphaerales bacterium]